MKVEIIAIGDELLLGNTINTNALFLSRELKNLGFKVDRHTVLSDDEISMKEGIEEALYRSNLIIVTGGLGPTEDDRTKGVVSKLFGSKLEYSEPLAEELFQKFEKNKYKKEQASLPTEAQALKNEIGTAPGFIFEKDGKALILLPGVPYEMEKMFFSYLPDYIKIKFDIKNKIFEECLSICLKKEDDVEPILEILREMDNDVKIGIYPDFATVRVSLAIEEKDEKLAQAKIYPLKKKLEEVFAPFIFFSGEKGISISEAVRDIFISKGKTLALAESCTGGAIASELTSMANASCYFLGSIVSYSNDLKKNILHVQEKVIEAFGAVSKETVREMVKGIFEITEADYSIAVSGIAGPGGGSHKKPVGTVCFAIGKRGEKVDAGTILIHGDREFIIKYSVSFALSLIWVRISHDLTHFTR